MYQCHTAHAWKILDGLRLPPLLALVFAEVALGIVLPSNLRENLVTTWESDRKNNTILEKRAKFPEPKARNYQDRL